ncbi:MAG: hypothetical protein HC767_01055 [Akkermansiaceae bacterium]|nr:hypothetical protein [Akkermansiaceae bacterium]
MSVSEFHHIALCWISAITATRAHYPLSIVSLPRFPAMHRDIERIPFSQTSIPDKSSSILWLGALGTGHTARRSLMLRIFKPKKYSQYHISSQALLQHQLSTSSDSSFGLMINIDIHPRYSPVSEIVNGGPCKFISDTLHMHAWLVYNHHHSLSSD